MMLSCMSHTVNLIDVNLGKHDVKLLWVEKKKSMFTPKLRPLAARGKSRTKKNHPLASRRIAAGARAAWTLR